MALRPIDFSEQLRMLSTGVQTKPLAPSAKEAAPGTEKASFGDFLAKQLEETNRQGIEAEQAIARAAAGEETSPHATMIAVQKATVSLTLMMSIKDRLERAYQEIIRTPVG